jgi:glutathione S-transferase
MKVYGHPISTCTRKVLMTLAEKQHPAELIIVDLQKAEQKQPAHLARQPFGVVPAIDDDGFQMYESRAIIRYLDARLPGTALTPADLRERGRMEQWMSVESSYFTPAAMKMIYQLVFNRWRGLETDQGIVDKARGEVGRALDVVDKALAGKQYLAGEQLSLAEISFMPYLEYLTVGGAGDLMSARENVGPWWDRIRQRPTWQQVSGGQKPAS